MQVQTQNIQRPSLFSDKSVTSNLRKIAKTTLNNNRRLLRLTLRTTRQFHKSLKLSLGFDNSRLYEVRNMFKNAHKNIKRS